MLPMGRKRGRDDDAAAAAAAQASFGEHRHKRRLASLPHRTSLNHAAPSQVLAVQTHTMSTGSHVMPSASHAMTPTDSDCDESTPYHAPVSAFSPWTSPAQSQSQSQRLRSSQVPDSQSTVASSDAMDMDMPDWYHLSQGGSQGEHALTSVTPVHQMHPPRGSYTHGYSDGVMRTRRPPSPVSEGEPSPRPGSGGDMMAMAMDTPSKRGHVRSRYSVKSWGDDAEHLRLGMHGGGASGASGDTGDAAAAAAAAAAGQVDGETEEHTKKSFSMGYRNDCERCLRREKGHFSHFS